MSTIARSMLIRSLPRRCPDSAASVNRKETSTLGTASASAAIQAVEACLLPEAAHGTMAMIRTGPPVPPLIFIGNAKMVAPQGGKRSSAATFSSA